MPLFDSYFTKQIEDKPWTDDAKEIGRQFAAGVAVDLPRMAGQALRYVAPDGSDVDEFGRSLVESADQRAPGWEPNMQGRGLVSGTLIKGARSIPASIATMAPALAGPAGAIASAGATLGLFGASAAQDTEDKLINQGVSREDAAKAGALSGVIQGGGELIANRLSLGMLGATGRGLGIMKDAAKAGGLPKMVEAATSSAVLKPWASATGKAMVGEPITEVSQDLGTEAVERAYGAKPQDMWEIAKDSAQGAVGMTALMAPFGLVGHRAQANRQAALGTALDSTDPTQRLLAEIEIARQAKAKGFTPAEISDWIQSRRNTVAEPQTIDDNHGADLLQPVVPAQPLGARLSQSDISGLLGRQVDPLTGIVSDQNTNRRLTDTSVTGMLGQQVDPLAASVSEANRYQGISDTGRANLLGAPSDPLQGIIANRNDQSNNQVPSQVIGGDRTGYRQGLVIGKQKAESHDLLLPEQPKQQLPYIEPDIAAALYPSLAQKADSGQKLTPLEQHILESVNSQPGVAQLRANPINVPDQSHGQFKLDGNPVGSPFAVQPEQARPSFELEMQDPRQGQLDLQPTEQAAPQPQLQPNVPYNKKGTQGQLAFEPQFKSPRAQEMWGIAQSLQKEGILDEGTAVQLQTLLANSRFGDAAKIVQDHLKQKNEIDKTKELADKVFNKGEKKDEPATKTETKPSEPVDPDIQLLDDALTSYNSAPAGESLHDKRNHLNKVLDAASYINEVANDEGEKSHVRKHAQAMLDEHIDPKDIAAAQNRDSGKVMATNRKGSSTGQMTHQEVLDVVNKLGNLNGRASIKVVQSVPGSNTDGSVTKGVTLADGSIEINSAAAESPVDVLRTVFHELFHRGVRSMFKTNDEYVNSMLDLRDQSADVEAAAIEWKESLAGKEAWDEIQKSGPMNFDKRRNFEAMCVEEGLAKLAERIGGDKQLGSKLQGTVRTIANWLAKLADKVGLRTLAQSIRSMSYNQIEQFVHETIGRAGDPVLHESGPMFRKEAEPSPAGKAIASSFAKVPGAHTKAGKWVQDALLNLRENPLVLRFMTNDMIADWYDKSSAGALLKGIVSSLGKMGSRANHLIELTAENTKLWRALPPEMADKMSTLMLESTLGRMHVSIKDKDGKYLGIEDVWKHDLNKHIDHKNANEREAFNRLFNQWLTLSPAARKVYDAVRDDLAQKHEATLHALRVAAAATYQTSLQRVLTKEELQKLADSTDIAKTTEELIGHVGTQAEQRAFAHVRQALRDINSHFGTMQGPYFPLVRFGDHVVIAKSAAVRDFEEKLDGIKSSIQTALEREPDMTDDQLEAHEAHVADLRKQYADMRTKLDTIKKNSKDYRVEFFESASEAERRRMELQSKAAESDEIVRTLREHYLRGISGASPSFVKRMEEAVTSALATTDGVTNIKKEEAIAAVRDLWMQQSPERSALRSELSRKDVVGVRADQMMRGYAHQGRASSWRISRLENSRDVTEALLKMSADKKNPDSIKILNEMKSRFVNDLQYPTDNKFIQTASNLTYFWQLGFNLSYFVTNATQAWTTSLPILAGRHGVRQSSAALSASSNEVIKLLKAASVKSIKENGAVVGLQLRLTEDHLKALAKDESELAMLRELTDNGAIDISIRHDLGLVADGTGDIPVLSKAMEISGILANYPETYNRLATALASYRMEKSKAERDGVANPEAVASAYAERIINRTHFNYSAENSASITRGPLGKMAFQFKRYQMGMVYLYTDLIRKSFGNGTPQEISDARKGLAYLIGATFATSGLAGLPIAAPVALAAKLIGSAWPDDDEPEIIQMAYNGMKDVLGEHVAQAIGKGLPAALGVDLSGKLGSGSILNPVAFANTDGKKVFSMDYWTQIGFSMLGATLATAAKFMDGIGKITDGNVRGVEEVLPNALANFAKAMRLGSQGELSKQGDVLVSPDEFNPLELGARAMGFALTDSTDMYQNRAAYNNMLQRRKDARNSLLQEAGQDRLSGNDTTSVDEKIEGFNERHPDDRIKGKDIASYLKNREKARQQMREGLRVGKRDQSTYDKLM